MPWDAIVLLNIPTNERRVKDAIKVPLKSLDLGGWVDSSHKFNYRQIDFFTTPACPAMPAAGRD